MPTVKNTRKGRIIPIDKPLVLRVLEYATGDYPRFQLSELKKELKLTGSEHKMVENYIASNIQSANPNHILIVVDEINLSHKTNVFQMDPICELLPSAVMMYNEFEEIRLARENAEYAKEQSHEANKLALRAFRFSLVIGIISLIVAVIQIVLAIK